MKIGFLVKAKRKEKGISRKDLRYRAKLSESYLKKLESGRIRRPNPETLEQLCVGLGSNWWELVSPEDRTLYPEKSIPSRTGFCPDRYCPGNLVKGAVQELCLQVWRETEPFVQWLGVNEYEKHVIIVDEEPICPACKQTLLMFVCPSCKHEISSGSTRRCRHCGEFLWPHDHGAYDQKPLGDITRITHEVSPDLEALLRL